MKDKQSLRAKILQYRRNLVEDSSKGKNEDFNKSASDMIIKSLLSLVLYHKPEIIGFYWPLTGEPNLLGIIPKVNAKCALPLLDNSDFSFTKYDLDDKLTQTKFKNLLQSDNNLELVPDFVIVPALAFDMQGYRIGFGMGYYDRYFAKNAALKSQIKVGVCFHDFLFPEFNHEAYDFKMDYVVTDKILIKIDN